MKNKPAPVRFPGTAKERPRLGVRAVAALLAAVLGIMGCARSGRETPATADLLSMQDSYGRAIKVPANPRRIVSIAPSMTEIIFLLGAGDRLVGRTDYCNYPPEAASVPSVGTLMNPGIEKIASLRPDLVVASDHFQKETLAALGALKIPVYISMAITGYEEVYTMVRDLGLILRREEEADRVIGDMRRKMEEIAEKARRASHKPKVYYMLSYGDEGDYTAGEKTHISHLIRTAGGINIGDAIEGWRISIEALFQNEPDLILCGKTGGALSRLPHTPPYNRLKAVRSGRVYEIDMDLIDRIGPRNLEGLEIIAKIFHPELFQ
jgi:iron complex transport system substrate-binding protein